ncbi:MAG: hypothetical protein C0621_03030 [Desulfuromonas sp.]|nr:MAG: hypothetical protein C0621_03030 [Desulfuromonas sp.]
MVVPVKRRQRTPRATDAQLLSTSAPPSHKGVRDVQNDEALVTLEFVDADLRRILQLIAEVSGRNVIYGDEINGRVSLKLVDVPWSQALDIVLQMSGLGVQPVGDVLWIRPKKDITTTEIEDLKAQNEKMSLEPVITRVIKVKYAPVEDIATKIKAHLQKYSSSYSSFSSKDVDEKGDDTTYRSSRNYSYGGEVTSDVRTRQIIVTARASIIQKIEEEVVNRLDVPERQVMIEARIVEASSSFGHDLGVNWGVQYANPGGGPLDTSAVSMGLGGGFTLATPVAGASATAGMGTGITFGRLGIDSTVLDLQISALETSGEGRVVSTPRISALNGGEATISQGTKIPYQQTSDAGTSTEFIDADLKLVVVPVINPDETIILDIKASNSTIGSLVSTGAGTAPAVDTKVAETKVLVKNGETTVIGGVFVENDITSESGVPLLSKIPILGNLFKSTKKSNTRSELLIFITPRILDIQTEASSLDVLEN